MALRRRRPGLTYPTGEDWHYVGESGEPAFGASWSNAASDRNLAFRIRETGIVDIQGYVENTDAPTAPLINTFFTLPVGYWPAADTFQGTVTIKTDAFGTDGYVVSPLNVTSAGEVAVAGIDNDPVISGAYVGVAQYVWINGQFFLIPASAP